MWRNYKKKEKKKPLRAAVSGLEQPRWAQTVGRVLSALRALAWRALA
jgi:hypothetical protein